MNRTRSENLATNLRQDLQKRSFCLVNSDKAHWFNPNRPYHLKPPTSIAESAAYAPNRAFSARFKLIRFPLVSRGLFSVPENLATKLRQIGAALCPTCGAIPCECERAA